MIRKKLVANIVGMLNPEIALVYAAEQIMDMEKPPTEINRRYFH